jgi:hypothetical protein
VPAVILAELVYVDPVCVPFKNILVDAPDLAIAT